MKCFNQVSKQALYASLQQPSDNKLHVTETVHLMDFNGFYEAVCSGLILDVALQLFTVYLIYTNGKDIAVRKDSEP